MLLSQHIGYFKGVLTYWEFGTFMLMRAKWRRSYPEIGDGNFNIKHSHFID